MKAKEFHVPRCGSWTPASQPPTGKLVSTSMETVRLIVFPTDPHFQGKPCVGWYIGSLKEWRVEGSPSSFEVTHWMPMPERP